MFENFFCTWNAITNTETDKPVDYLTFFKLFPLILYTGLVKIMLTVMDYFSPAGERPVAARLLRSWVRIPPGAWIFVCCECRVLSRRGLCDELISRPEESYRLWCVVVCDLETSRIGAPHIYDISNLRVNRYSGMNLWPRYREWRWGSLISGLGFERKQTCLYHL